MLHFRFVCERSPFAAAQNVSTSQNLLKTTQDICVIRASDAASSESKSTRDICVISRSSSESKTTRDICVIKRSSSESKGTWDTCVIRAPAALWSKSKTCWRIMSIRALRRRRIWCWCRCSRGCPGSRCAVAGHARAPVQTGACDGRWRRPVTRAFAR